MNNLSVRELYASIPDSRRIAEFFRLGIEIGNDRLAVSAMEEMLRRNESSDIVDVLDASFLDGILEPDSSLFSLMVRSLMESSRESDPFLSFYARALYDGDFVGPSDWLSRNADKYRKTPNSGAVKNARSWARACLNLPRNHDASLTSRTREEIERLSDGRLVLPGNDR